MEGGGPSKAVLAQILSLKVKAEREIHSEREIHLESIGVDFSDGISGSFLTQVISNLLIVSYGSFVDNQSVIFPFVYCLTSFCVVLVKQRS